MDWISTFLDYTDGLPSPELFRKWAAIGTVAGALERRVWCSTARSKLYPNLFILLVSSPGVGKCLERSERILRYDGTIDTVSNIVAGDTLMGPDGQPRTVLETWPGKGPLYSISPTKGRSWKCNGEHILSLRKTRKPNQGSIKYVTVNEWLKWNDYEKSQYKLWRTAEVTFPQRLDPKLSPYFLGLHAGDGTNPKYGVEVTTADPEITAEIMKTAELWGLEVMQEAHYRKRLVSREWKGQWCSNGLLDELRRLGLGECGAATKFIPHEYKTGSRETRLEVLAGLIDSDGSLMHGGYDFISKSRQLSEDIAFIARSLGFAAYVKKSLKSFNGTALDYWRVCISGATHTIPCRVIRKRAPERKMNKLVTNTGFNIYLAGEGEWHGLTVDIDNQYVLDDFTVIHNSQAIDPVMGLWGSVDNLHVGPKNMSRAGLIDALRANGTKRVVDGELIEYNSMLLAVGELGVLLPAHDLDFLSTLNDIYDNPPYYREMKRGIGKEIYVPFPHLNIIAGSQPGFLAELLPENAYNMGFTSRLIMVYQAEGPYVSLFDSVEPRTEYYDALVAGLRSTAMLNGPFTWARDAQIAMEEWAKAKCPPVPQHSKLTHYVPRRTLHTVKLSMVAAVSRTGTLHIELQDFTRARDWLLEAEVLMPDIFREMAQKSDKQIIEELHFYIWNRQVKETPPGTLPKGLPNSALYNFLQNRVPSEKIFRIIDVAEKAAILQRYAGTDMWVAKPKHDHGIE